MSSRIERQNFFQDDPRLVEELKPRRFNWTPLYVIFGSATFWAGIILAWLWRKGWL